MCVYWILKHFTVAGWVGCVVGMLRHKVGELDEGLGTLSAWLCSMDFVFKAEES